MCLFMYYLGIRSGKRFAAVAAFMRFFTGMCHFMSFLGTKMNKGLAAVAAYIRFSPVCVISCVFLLENIAKV